MSVADFLEKAGQDVAKGAKVAGSIALPIAERTAQVVSGEAPQIDEEKRQQQYKLEDQQIETKAKELENQMALGEKYGTLTPQQQQQYVDQISQLYSHPRHAGTLMEKLRQAVHPNGAVSTPGLSSLKDATPAGGTAAADEATQLNSLKQKTQQQSQQDREAMLGDIDFMKQNLTQFGIPPEQQQKFIQEYIARRTGVLTGKEGSPALDIKGGILIGAKDAEGQYYTASDLAPGGHAPDELKQQAEAYGKGEADKKKDADDKWNKEQAEINKRHRETMANESQRMLSMFQNAISMDSFKDAQKQIAAHETAYNSAADLQRKMQGLAPEARTGNQQAMMGILADHIAMTTHQPGAAMRPTKALFDEAASSQPWLDKLTKRVDDNGVLSGVVLSQSQIQQMVDMAQTQVDAERDTLQEMQQNYKEQLNPTATAPGGKTSKIKTLTNPPGGVIKSKESKDSSTQSLPEVWIRDSTGRLVKQNANR